MLSLEIMHIPKQTTYEPVTNQQTV